MFYKMCVPLINSRRAHFLTFHGLKFTPSPEKFDISDFYSKI